MEKINIDFYSKSNTLLLNPRLSSEDQRSVSQLAGNFKNITGHFWIATSGSTGSPKLVALSHNAVLHSAESVNRLLDATREDSWLLALPSFHVGGLGIIARAHLSSSPFHILPTWSALNFMESIKEHRSTLTSLVPTQLFDILSLDLPAPESLRACIIGGGPLSERMYQKARGLNWPILPSFGMTECASQIATASLKSLSTNQWHPSLEVLPHVTATQHDEILVLESPSLFTGYAEWAGEKPLFHDPKRFGQFVTEDKVVLNKHENSTEIIPLGRVSDTIKVLGELVSLTKLNALVSEIAKETLNIKDACITSLPDTRRGQKIILVGVGDTSSLREVFAKLVASVLPYERPQEIYQLQSLPRSDLGKLNQATVRDLIKKGAPLIPT